MKVELEDGGACRKILHIEAPAEALSKDYQDVLREYVRHGRVPGFRVGKAPTGVVEKHYLKGITEDVKDRAVPHLYREALEQQKIRPVAVIEVAQVDFSKDRGMRFSVTIDVVPEFKLPKYKKITVKANPVDVTDAQVDEAYGQLIERFTRFEEVAEGREVRDGDLVMVDYEGSCEGKPLEELASDCAGLGSGKDFLALAGEPEFLPGFAEGIRGARVGETREFPIRFPDDFRVPAVAGKEARYRFEVKGLRERKPPTIDAEFLKPFEVDSEEALRAKIREDLQNAAEDNERRRIKGEIGQHLLQKTELDVPKAVLDEEISLSVRNLVQQVSMQGATREQIVERRDEILGAATRTSTERVKLSYILSRIADEEKIEVEPSEVDSRITAMAGRYSMTAERLRAELEKRHGLEKLESDLREEKTLDVLLDYAKIKK